ncbi:MAG: WYL domain-containing protein [Paludibacteraceae bacterium]|nr:WYL domain-containing protein [Paludibacteraceae bacterium]
MEDLREACEKELLEKEGICGISTRTIQRDIELMRSDKLGYNAPIVVKNKKYYTYEDLDYSITKLPLSQKDLNELSSALEIIKHYNGFSNMSGQEDILTRMQDKIACQTDNQKVVFIETNEKLKGLNFLGPLFDAIKKKNALAIEYKSFKAKRESRLYISPYILKEFNNRWFLIGMSTKNIIMTLALDRIIAIKKDDKHQYTNNTIFDPETYLGEMVGVTRELDSKVETVILWVSENQAPYVETKPFHHTQEIEKENVDGSKIFRLRIIINYELERKILGYGPHIKVIEPKHLKQRIANELILAAERYRVD